MDTHSLQKESSDTVSVSDKTMDARAVLKLLHEVENLKRLPRAGWVIKNIQNSESVAEHSFRLTIMTFFAPVRQSCHHICLR
jgi:5'-deoxynucleotidase YfbR-like HD superfamily hydrolase